MNTKLGRYVHWTKLSSIPFRHRTRNRPEVELIVPNLLNLVEIKARRQALGLTLTQAAIAAGWKDKGRTTWHDIEVGRRQNITLDTLAAMATALRCSFHDLLVKKA
jgi:DNA-binding Xre family transcriptional regulator